MSVCITVVNVKESLHVICSVLQQAQVAFRWQDTINADIKNCSVGPSCCVWSCEMVFVDPKRGPCTCEKMLDKTMTVGSLQSF